MFCWKLTQTLPHPNDPDWETLVSSVLGVKVHTGRKAGFCLAREALRVCLREQGHNLEIKDLMLKNYSQLKLLPSLTLSLSHTENWGAAIVGNKKEYQGLGIDIESIDRPVSSPIVQRITHPEDETLRNIELWCLKEAAFKALMNSGLFDTPVEFSTLRITPHTWTHSPSGIKGGWELDKTKKMIVARAFLKS